MSLAQRTTSDILNGLDNLSVYRDLAQQSTILDAIFTDPSRTDTLLVPTNDAFSNSGILLQQLRTPPYATHLQFLVGNHFLDENVTVDGLDTFFGVWRTQGNVFDPFLPADRIQVEVDGASTTLHSDEGAWSVMVQRESSNILATNGIVHTLDGVMWPSYLSRTVANSSYSIPELNSWLVETGLDVPLSNGEWTFWEPARADFPSLVGIAPDEPGYIDRLRELLALHFVEGVWPISLLQADVRTNLRSLNGYNYTLVYDPIFDGWEFVPFEIGGYSSIPILPGIQLFSNGISHLLNEPLRLPVATTNAPSPATLMVEPTESPSSFPISQPTAQTLPPTSPSIRASLSPSGSTSGGEEGSQEPTTIAPSSSGPKCVCSVAILFLACWMVAVTSFL